MSFKALQEKRQFVNGKFIVGIDLSKDKHLEVLDTNGIQIKKEMTGLLIIPSSTKYILAIICKVLP